MASGMIQPRLPGFLDLLQLKNQGRQPPVLGDEVGLTIDVSQWYALDRVQVDYNYLALASGFTSNNIVMFTVPAGQTWLLVHASVQLVFNPAALTAIVWDRFVPYMQIPGVSAGLITELADVTRFDSTAMATFPNGATTIQGPGRTFQAPLLLPAGTNIGVSFCGDVTDPGVSAVRQMRIGYVPLAV